MTIPAKRIEQLTWANWSNFCELHSDLVSRDNEARSVDTFASMEKDHAGPWIEVTIPAKISDEDLDTIVRHGDYVALLENGKLQVIRFEDAASSLVSLVNARNEWIDPAIALFDFDPKEFPLWSVWIHTSGNSYIITGYNNTNKPQRPGYPTMIEYHNINTNEKFSGPAWDWNRRMKLKA